MGFAQGMFGGWGRLCLFFFFFSLFFYLSLVYCEARMQLRSKVINI